MNSLHVMEALESRRLLAAGGLDPFFGGQGLVKPDIDTPLLTKVYELLSLPDGKFLAAVRFSHPKPENLNDFDPTVALIRVNRDGSADKSFGDGDAVIDTGIFGMQRADLLRQADGKILLATGLSLARFHPDGSFDSSFDGDGQLVMNATEAQLALEPDGKILVGGARSGSLYVQRFNVDGTPDNTFNSDSVATVHNVGPSGTAFSGFARMPNGTMYLGGVWTVVPQNDVEIATQEFVVAHLRENGTLDTAYGPSGTGILTKRMTVFIGLTGLMLVEPNEEKVLFCIINDLNHLIFRYDRHGAPDLSYGDAGRFTARPRNGPTTEIDAQVFVLQSNGAVVVGGSVSNGTSDDFVYDPALARTTPLGQAELTFGNSGRATGHLPGAIPPSNDRSTNTEAITFTQDGSILVGATDRDRTFSLLRFWRDDAPAAEVIVRPVVAASSTSLVIDVDYRDDGPIDTELFGDRDLRITGPNGFVAYAKFNRISSRSSDGRRVRVRYKLAARGGSWEESDNGNYDIRLRANRIADEAGHFSASRMIGRAALLF